MKADSYKVLTTDILELPREVKQLVILSNRAIVGYSGKEATYFSTDKTRISRVLKEKTEDLGLEHLGSYTIPRSKAEEVISTGKAFEKANNTFRNSGRDLASIVNSD